MNVALLVSGIISIILGFILVLSNPLESLAFLACNRVEGIYSYGFCTRTKIIASEIESKLINLQDIQAARVEEVKEASSISVSNSREKSFELDQTQARNEVTSQSSSTQYRLVLTLAPNNEVFPLTNYASDKNFEVARNKINAFIDSTENSLVLELERSYSAR